ncbi:S1 RNA-binding domain-containing protein [Actinomadura sp. WMMB 499]|uniref:S1 RNA-binding domain-containing protein n=1 Tax=Actinomadura sp. WMMB 499 TaxID=1219491 RepID=UPI00159E55F3|nr:S1 RNA-binding domain-containing protein [Actinomadura sp. WMMB 499]
MNIGWVIRGRGVWIEVSTDWSCGLEGWAGALSALEVGSVVVGRVTAVKDFGVLVDLGSAEGVITVPNLSWHHFDHPSDVLSVGEHVRVKVLDIDRERERISLSVKHLLPDPLLEVSEKIDSVTVGEMTFRAPIGVFIRIFGEFEGLLPEAEMSKFEDGIDWRPGRNVRVRIARVDLERRQIGLTFP